MIIETIAAYALTAMPYVLIVGGILGIYLLVVRMTVRTAKAATGG